MKGGIHKVVLKHSLPKFILACVLAGWGLSALADGTENLGTPGIGIGAGTGIVAAGTGLQDVQPGPITIDVPGNVVQVLLYWTGAVTSNAPSDDTINVDGNPVNGILIGGPTLFFTAFGKDFYYSAYRADITGLGLVGSGLNSLSIDGLDNKDGDGHGENSGAGLLVIFDDGSATTDIQIRDGSDLAFVNFVSPLDTTVPQTFAFAAAASDRTADLVIFAGSVGEADRPNAIEITVNGTTTTLVNPLFGSDGALWDTLTTPVNIPAGATQATVQLLSQGDGTGNLPASFNWVGAGLSVLPEQGEGCTPGYWRNHLDSWPPTGLAPGDDFDTTFGVDFFNPDITLEQAVNLGGGGIKKVARHGTAALLNALHPDVNYPLTAAEVIALVQAGDVDTLVAFNELSDTCPAE